MDLAEYEETRPRGRRRKANPWWQPSPEDYYSPFDEHFDLSDCSDGSDSEDEDFDSLETKGAFGVMSTELLFRLSSYLDLQSLCRGSYRHLTAFNSTCCIPWHLTHPARDICFSLIAFKVVKKDI
jgi:hypothetical protein